MKKVIIAVVVGVIAGLIIVFIGGAIIHSLYTPQVKPNASEKEVLEAFVATISQRLLVVMLLYWLLSSFIGGFVAGKINPKGWKTSSLITGGVLLSGSLISMIILPHPSWMIVSSIILYLPLAYEGGRRGSGKSRLLSAAAPNQ